MMISTKGRYALRVMVDIAENQRDGYIPLKEIAYRQDISEKYLEAIVKGLVKERYLTGLRGKSGGYRLTRAPEDYTVGAILRITEGSLAPVACLEQEHVDCPRMADCRTLPMWRKLNTMIQDFFDGITLADLMTRIRWGTITLFDIERLPMRDSLPPPASREPPPRGGLFYRHPIPPFLSHLTVFDFYLSVSIAFLSYRIL